MIRLWQVEAYDSLNDVRITIYIHDESEDFALRRAQSRLSTVMYSGVPLTHAYTWTILEVSETKTIRQFHGDDVWRDDEGTTWVRQEQLIEAVQFASRPTSVAVGSVVPDEICGLRNLITGVGSCSFLPNHEGKHSWEW